MKSGLRYKYLVIRFSSIGDIVLTTPVLRALKKRRPDAEIHFVTKSKFADMLVPNPYIDHIHVLQDSLRDLLRELRHEHFDYVLDLHGNLRSLIIKFCLGEKTFSVHKESWKKWLLTTFKINLLSQENHVVHRYMDTLRELRVHDDGGGLDFFIPTNVSLPDALDKLTAAGNFIALAAGAQHATKRMPWPRMAQLCRRLSYPIVLLGGSDIADEAAEMAKLVPNVTNTCGSLSLFQSALVVKRAKLVIAHDTGLMHIAAALGKDILSVWGNTVPAFGMTPYRPGKNSKIFQVQNLHCRPCSRIGYERCPKGHFRCMEEQDYEGMAEWVGKR